jgi:hypothetical protein
MLETWKICLIQAEWPGRGGEETRDEACGVRRMAELARTRFEKSGVICLGCCDCWE